VRIKLGDGQEWSFPLPRIRMVPKRNGDGQFTFGFKPAPGQGNILGKSFDLLWTIQEQEPDDAWGIRFGAAACLLQMNYNLTDENLEDLIYLDKNDPETFERWRDIEQILRGLNPKERLPAGSN
jgi:hypothetical protein